ncbi:MAG: hypothetical protein SGPRY_006367 [Prymnesium sp.]
MREEEVDFILSECNRVVRRQLSPKDVRAAWAGVRPLVADPNAPLGDTKSLSREHVVESLPSGLVTIAGGKWTTYRKMAQDAVDMCCSINPALSHAQPCKTAGTFELLGSDRLGEVCKSDFDLITSTLREEFELSSDMARHLRYNYGTNSLQVVQIALDEPHRMLLERLHPSYPLLRAEVVFASRHEFAETAVDVLAHRTRLSFLNAAAALESLPDVLQLMREEKGWGDERVESEREAAVRYLRIGMNPAPGASLFKKRPDPEMFPVSA